MPTASASGSPRLPPTNVGRPVARSISPTSVVTVDLPLVPVMATMVAETNCDASSSSPVISTPAARAAASSGISGDARRKDDQVGAEEGLAPVPAQLVRHAGRQLRQGGAELGRRPLVGHGDPRAARRAEPRRRDPGASETDHEHAFVSELDQAGPT